MWKCGEENNILRFFFFWRLCILVLNRKHEKVIIADNVHSIYQELFLQNYYVEDFWLYFPGSLILFCKLCSFSAKLCHGLQTTAV